MSLKGLHLVALDTDEDLEHHFGETSTVIDRRALSSGGIFGVPELSGAFVPATAAVTAEGTIFVFTELTPQWVTIYPSIQPEPSLDILEGLDIPFKPKRTRRTSGIVVRRRKARFKTAFADDLDEEMHANK